MYVPWGNYFSISPFVVFFLRTCTVFYMCVCDMQCVAPGFSLSPRSLCLSSGSSNSSARATMQVGVVKTACMCGHSNIEIVAPLSAIGTNLHQICTELSNARRPKTGR